MKLFTLYSFITISFPCAVPFSARISLFAFRYEDFELLHYDPWPAIKAPVAV